MALAWPGGYTLGLVPTLGGGGVGLGLIDWMVRNLTILRYPSQPEGWSTPPLPQESFTLYLQSWEVKSLTNPHKRGAANNFRMKLLHFQSSGTLSLSRGIGGSRTPTQFKTQTLIWLQMATLLRNALTSTGTLCPCIEEEGKGPLALCEPLSDQRPMEEVQNG